MKIKKQSAILIIILINGLLMITGCHFNSTTNKMVFRYNEPTGIATLDPAFAKNQSIIWAVHQIFNTLVENDSNLQIIPSLARSWEVNAERTKYIFHLRTDVYFHDNGVFAGGRGRKMVAGDVVYSLQRIIDPKTASSGAWIFHNRVDAASGFQAIDDSTFQLQLLRPFNPILGLLSMPYCSIVPKEVIEKYGPEFRNHPCGTGPFDFFAWDEGQALVLHKNEHYFEKDSAGNALPYLDAVRVSFYDNKATEFLLLQQGQLDFINDIDASFKDEVLDKRGNLKADWKGKLVLSKHPYLNTEYLGVLVDTNNELVKQSPLRWKKVRQAINYGFDRRKMMMYLRNGIGIPAESGFVPAGFPSFDSTLVKGYHYDPAKSRQLLAEAGFPNGAGLPVIKLLTVPVYAEFGSFIARQLEETGIPVQVEVIRKSLLIEETAQSKALFFRGSWIADYPDAENYLSVFYSKNPAPPNYTRYRNPEYDALYEQCLTVQSDSLRMDLYRQMDQWIVRDAPVIPLWYDEVIRLVKTDVKGFVPNSLNLLELRNVKIE